MQLLAEAQLHYY